MDDTSVIRHERANIFAFTYFFWFKKPVKEAKTKFAFRLFNWAIQFYSAYFIHDID